MNRAFEGVVEKAERFWRERHDRGSVPGLLVSERAERRRADALRGLETAMILLKQDGPLALSYAKSKLEIFVAEGELEGWFEPLADEGSDELLADALDALERCMRIYDYAHGDFKRTLSRAILAGATREDVTDLGMTIGEVRNDLRFYTYGGEERSRRWHLEPHVARWLDHPEVWDRDPWDMDQ